jgi:hypothetical protein
MMDGSYLTAFVGLAGAVIGGLASFGTNWITQRAQSKDKLRASAHARRERLYTEFIKEASRLFGDALGHEKDDVSNLVTLYALIARIRLVSSDATITSADEVASAIIAAYLGPNLALHELRQYASQGGLDPLRHFSQTCRAELERFDQA